MDVIDLTHTIRPGMPVYPGTEPPVFERGTTLERDGFIETRISMFSHTGTHIDAPSHILPGGASLDRLPAGHFTGKALLFDASAAGSNIIDVESISGCGHGLGGAEFFIIKTGWSRYWGDDRYFRGFPCLTAGAARWLTRFPLKGVGVDAISVDPVDSKELPVHRELFAGNIIIIENLANLDSVPHGNFIFSCMPLKIIDADGSPVRAVAILEA